MIKKKQCLCCLPFILFAWSCTFNYGNSESSGNELPDLVMQNVDYIRVRAADPLARIQAERFERYDSKDLMKLNNIVFEQYGERGEEVNVYGKAGNAEVHIESGDIFMDNNVNLEVKTEDIILQTYQLEWIDESRSLSTGENDFVNIYRENGTRFTGIGLLANTRTRIWEFLRNVSGVYVHENNDEE